MPEGRCPKCGYHCIGWGLREPRNQICPKCGVGLEITDAGGNVFKGYSPFTAEKYSINLPTKAPASQDKEKDIREQNKQRQS